MPKRQDRKMPILQNALYPQKHTVDNWSGIRNNFPATLYNCFDLNKKCHNILTPFFKVPYLIK